MGSSFLRFGIGLRRCFFTERNGIVSAEIIKSIELEKAKAVEYPGNLWYTKGVLRETIQVSLVGENVSKMINNEINAIKDSIRLTVMPKRIFERQAGMDRRKSRKRKAKYKVDIIRMMIQEKKW